MSLVVGTVLLVSGVTALLGFIVWAVDRNTARQEREAQLGRSARNNA